MSAFRWTLGTFFVSAFFFFGITGVQADEEMATTPFDGVDLSYSSFSVVDTRLDTVEGNPDLILSAKLQNTGNDTRTFSTSVEFRGATEANQGESAVVHAPADYTVPAGEELSIAFPVFRPVSLMGTYDTVLIVSDDKGNTVTRTSLSQQELVATERVTVKNCTFGPSDGDNGVLVVATDEKQSEIIMACEAALTKGKPAVIRMVARMTDYRTATPVVLGEKTLALSTVAIPVRLFVPAKVAGQYQLEVVMINENNQDISAPVRVPLTVKGNGGKIRGLTELKKDSTQPTMLPVGVAVELYDDAEYALSLALLSDGVACAEPVSVAVQNTNLKDAMIQVTKNCPNPVLSATLLSGGSTVLDQAEKRVSPITGIASPMMESSFFDGILSKLPWIIVAVLGVFAGYFIFQKERLRRMAPVFVLALTSLFFGFSTHIAHAGSVSFTMDCQGGVCVAGNQAFYTFVTDKDVYAPNDTIRVTLTAHTDDKPSMPLCPFASLGINGGGYTGNLVSQCYSVAQLTAGIDIQISRPGPSATGPFTLNFSVGLGANYTVPAVKNISLSVAPAPTPTASLNISPSTATFPTQITFTLSSTNAQSCEVRETTQPFTYVDKSTNTTGITIPPSQVAVGTYQFQTRCWSGTNGTGTVSSTDNDTLTINAASPPSASFTSTPSCTIALNATGCFTTIGWTSANLTTAVLTDCGNAQIDSRGVGPQSTSGVYVPYNSGCYRIHDGTRTGPILATGNVNSSCTSGTTWNTNSLTCVSSGPAPVNGTCGSDAGRTLSSSPSNYCATGTVGNQDAYLSGDTFNSSGFISTGPANSFYLGHYWECNGSGGGSSRGCFAYRQPLCGSADGGSYSNAPTDDSSPMKQTLCQVGTPSSVTTNPTTYTWSCTNGTGPTDTCSATRTTGPTAQITARVVVASNNTNWWQKLISFVTGRDHTAQATGPNANITTNGTAAINWTSSGTPSCSITSTSPAYGPYNGTTGGVPSLLGSTLGEGTHTFTLSCSGAPQDSVKVIVTAAGGGAPSGPPGDGGGFFTATADTSCGSGTINLAWNPVSGATSYQLRDGSTTIYTGSETTYSHTNLVAGSNHSYTVRASNNNGNSAWSSVRNATAASACVGGSFTVNLTANPTNIVSGSSTLSWTTGGSPAWCWATGGTEGTWNNTWQSVSGGSRTVTPTSTTTYTMECGDASTSVSDTATVTVGSGFTCTGSMSNHATVHSGDSSGLSANTPYSYSASNTGPKCQYYCNTGYTWDGSQCAGPTVSLTASPSTIASGDSSTLTWTPSSGVTSCWATNGTSPWTNSSRSASGGTLAVSPSSTTTYSIECWNGAGVSTGIRNRTITVTGGGPAAAVNICPGSATLGVASTQQFAAYYTAAGVTFNGCGSPNGTNVTSSGSTTWSTSSATVAIMNNGGSKGLATGVAAGSATMSAVYSGLTGTASVTISCTPTNSCSSASSDTRAAGICAGDTFTITDDCGGTLTCSGTRVCDYNWKEVAP